VTISLPLPVEIITQSVQLDVTIQGMTGSSAIAIDTESNSLHRYPEQLCLIQIAANHKVYVVDTIVLKELEQENTRLKKVVADFALDNAILKEAARGNF
jgi:ribonuclease D